MRAITPALLVFCSISILAANLAAQSTKAWQMETAGDALGARALLQKEAAQGDAAALLGYAEFLDRHRDPTARAAYQQALTKTSDQGQMAFIARRLVALDLIAGDAAAARTHAAAYNTASGKTLTVPTGTPVKADPIARGTITVPGPLRSFARMAALSPDLQSADLLPALARNIVTSGYQAGNNVEGLEQTEYLKLIFRYLSQAREIEKLANKEGRLRIASCDSTETGDLLRVLGYRMRGGCGSEVVLETVNATRAFLTIDSGFPLSQLEQSLRTNQPFDYDFRPAVIPVLYGADYWLGPKDKGGESIDAFLGDPSICRLYLGLSKMHQPTAEALRAAVLPVRLKAFAHVIDFYGGMFEIRGGKALVPGGARSAKAWAELAGASPDQGTAFLDKLAVRDDGWLASFYDSLARIHGPVQEYLTEPQRLRRYYNAIRGKLTSPGPARPVFRANSDMLLLTTRLRLDQDGRPHIPGGIEVWKTLFIKHPHGKYDGKLTKAATGWKEPDDLVEALFALSRKAVENEPLKIYLALSDLDRRRATPLATATVERMVNDYKQYGAQYAVFSEAPLLKDATMLQYLDTAQSVAGVHDNMLRADVAGTLQGLIGIWQILCRQNTIEPAEADGALSGILTGFAKVKNSRELFDSGRAGVKTLLAAAKSPAGGNIQDRLTDLIAGASEFSDDDAHRAMIADMIRTFEAQRLVSLQTLFDLGDHLDAVAKGGRLNPSLVSKAAARITEIQLPRASLSTNEKNALAFGYWTDKHIDAERKLNLRGAIEKAGADPEKLRDIRGLLSPVLRDTLVGMNYVHYAPPGAQILQTNPLFVRSHDFLGSQSTNQTWRNTEVFGTGWPSSAGGRLVGSLAGLPYALAEAEQNFLIPSREQALIWGDLVPQMLVSAKVPRYWQVTPAQLHWVGLHLLYGEALLAEAAVDPARRAEVLEVYARQASPARANFVAILLESGDVRSALELVMPSEAYAMAAETMREKKDHGDRLAQEIRELAATAPDRLTYAAVSKAFGTPKPTLTNSYAPELLQLRTFPTLMGYSSRIMAEGWESNLLYYAALADEMHLPPAQLNLLVPEWTQATVEKIFATHLEDWPALLRSLRLVGEDVRQKSRPQTVAREEAVPAGTIQ